MKGNKSAEKLRRALKPYVYKTGKIAHKQGEVTYLVTEGDIGPALDGLAEVIIERYKRAPKAHYFTEDQHKNLRLGIEGGLAFQSMLNQWRVPYLVQEPIFTWPAHKIPYDFIIRKPGGEMLRLEVKTFTLDDGHVLVKDSDWDGVSRAHGRPNYLIVLRKLPTKVELRDVVDLDELGKAITKKLCVAKGSHFEIALPEGAVSASVFEIAGWLAGAEVEDPEHHLKKGEKPWSKNWACYAFEWHELHNWKGLEPEILKCAIGSLLE